MKRFEYRERRPHAALAPFVRVLWTLEASEPGPPASRTEPIDPDGCVEWILHFAEPCHAVAPDGALRRQGRELVAGPSSRAVQLARGRETRALGVRFEPGAARALGAMTKAPQAPLADVALAAGFADQAHFCREFRRHAGTTPSEHRRAAGVLTRAFAPREPDAPGDDDLS